MVHGSDRQVRSACPRGLPKGARRRIFALPLTPAYRRFAGTALRLSTVACQLVSLTPLEVERAAYVWRLQCEDHALDNRLADLRVTFQWLLQIHAGDTTVNLIRARAAYVAELYAEKHDLDTEIADLAKLHHVCSAAKLDARFG